MRSGVPLARMLVVAALVGGCGTVTTGRAPTMDPPTMQIPAVGGCESDSPLAAVVVRGTWRSRPRRRSLAGTAGHRRALDRSRLPWTLATA